MRCGRAWLWACAVPLFGCGEELEPFGVTWRRDGLAYHARSDDPFACVEALPPIARHRSGFAEFFGMPHVAGTRLEYFKYRDNVDYQRNAGCPPTSAGCFDGNVHSPLPLHHHELLHAWVRSGIDVYTRILSEGLATALSCSPLAKDSSTAALTLDMSDPDGPGYEHAGRLVTQALREGSVDDLLFALAWADTAGRDEAAVREAFSRTYGSTLEELYDRALAERAPPCFALGRCASAAPLELGVARFEGTCEGPPARLLSSEAGPALGLRVTGDPLDVLACAPSAAPFALRHTGIGDAGASAPVELFTETPAEPHLLTATGQFAAFETLLQARVADGLFSPICPDDAATVLDAGALARLVVPQRAARLYFSLEVEQARALGVRWSGHRETDPGAEVFRCAGCDGEQGAECVAIDAAAGAEVEVGDRLLLRIDSSAAAAPGLTLELR